MHDSNFAEHLASSGFRLRVTLGSNESVWQARPPVGRTRPVASLPVQFSAISQTAKSQVRARAVYDAGLWTRPWRGARTRRGNRPREVEFADAR